MDRFFAECRNFPFEKTKKSGSHLPESTLKPPSLNVHDFKGQGKAWGPRLPRTFIVER